MDIYLLDGVIMDDILFIICSCYENEHFGFNVDYLCQQDVSGSYVYEFPGMRNVSLSSADAFVIVFALDDYSTWEEASRLRDMVHEAKDCADSAGQQQQQQAPIVVVGNKCEVEKHDGDIMKETPEATVVFDWENGYVETSAKERRNINKIFKELLVQARSRYDFGWAQAVPSRKKSTKRRSSLTALRKDSCKVA